MAAFCLAITNTTTFLPYSLPLTKFFPFLSQLSRVHALKNSMYGWEKVQWWIRWRLLNDRYTLLSHQFHFQKQFRFPGLHPQKRAMCTNLTFIHRCCLQTPCFTHRPLDFYFFLRLKFIEEFGAIYGKLYFSAILSNSLPWVRPSRFLHQWQSYADTEDGSQSNQCPDREQPDHQNNCLGRTQHKASLFQDYMQLHETFQTVRCFWRHYSWIHKLVCTMLSVTLSKKHHIK